MSGHELTLRHSTGCGGCGYSSHPPPTCRGEEGRGGEGSGQGGEGRGVDKEGRGGSCRVVCTDQRLHRGVCDSARFTRRVG